MNLSFFGLILIAATVIGIGLGALALLSLVINKLTSRGKAQPPDEVGAWSGLKSAVGISAALVAVLLAVGALSLVRVSRPTSQTVVSQRAIVIRKTQVHQDATRQSAFDPVNQASGSAKPGIELQIDVNDRSTVSAGVEVSGKSADQSDKTSDEASPGATVDTTSVAATERRKVQLEQMIGSIGQFLRSQLEKVGDKSTANAFGQAAKSDNGDVVIFQPSDAMVQQILGDGGQELLKSFNSELPGRIRQTYALIPLTPPVGSAVPMNPMIATGGLEMLANSIVAYVEHANSVSSIATSESAALKAEAEGTLTVAPEIRPEPEWMSKTEGRRLVAKSKPVFPDDEDRDFNMTDAINEALAKHVEAVAAGLNPSMIGQAKYVHMELPQALADKYIIDEYERSESMELDSGGTPFQIRYALVEFPDTIDQIAVRQIRKSVQRDRIIGLAVVVGLSWLSVCSAGFVIRLWQKGTKLRKIAATPVFAVITITTLLLTVAMVFFLARGEVPRGPWNETPVTIDLANMEGVK